MPRKEVNTLDEVVILAGSKWFGREDEVFEQLKKVIAGAIIPVMSIEESDCMKIVVSLELDRDKVRNEMLEFLD